MHKPGEKMGKIQNVEQVYVILKGVGSGREKGRLLFSYPPVTTPLSMTKAIEDTFTRLESGKEETLINI